MTERNTENTQELISVIVPVYNKEKRLPRCLDSLAGQSWKNLEIILIDDGSTDESGKICEAYSEKDVRFTTVHTENRGVSAARNTGLSLMHGEYCMFADPDDLVCSVYAERLYQILQKSGLDVAACLAYDCYDTEISTFPSPEPLKFRILSVDHYNYMERWSHRVVWGAIYRKWVLKDLRFDTGYDCSTDTLFFAQVLKRCRRYAHTDEELYCYIQYTDSITGGRFDRKRYSDILVWKAVAALFSDTVGIIEKSAADNVVLKCAKALKQMWDEGSEDVELAEMLQRELLSQKDRIQKLPVCRKIRISILWQTLAPKSFYFSRRLIRRLRDNAG